MQTSNALHHLDYYRLPWTLPDNAISWLEPTSQCNLSCDGCYRENLVASHKPMEEIRAEIDAFLRLRNCDGISVAGGDPLTHPRIVDIVAAIAAKGAKPILNTNGSLLTKELLHALKQAGAYGFTFHIDSKQGRPHWKNATEEKLNELRLTYAEMLAAEGGLSCAFNATVYDDTMQEVPAMLEWAARQIDIVQVMVFILFRQAVPALPFDWYVGAQKVDMMKLVYGETADRQVTLTAHDLVAAIRERFPDFSPCAYLNGTEQPDSFKWLLSGRVGTKERIHGYVGSKFMEIIQTGNHLLSGKYLAYATPKMTRKGRSMLLLSPFDRGVRGIAGSWLSSLLTRPLDLVRGLHFQSVMIIQPVDFLANGAQSMCDGCPDMTIMDNKLVWSCRMEELKHFGDWVRTVPKIAD